MQRLLFALVFCLGSGLAFKAEAQGTLSAPYISANSLFLYRSSNFHSQNANIANPDQEPNGADVQEAELQLYADVDPYSRLNLLLSISPQYVASGNSVTENWTIAPEEAYDESSYFPGVTFKIGKFKAFMGKHNLMHTHAFPFIKGPLANVALLGDEGLNDAGASAAILVPVSWFSEVTLQYLRDGSANTEFNAPAPGNGIGLVHYKNLWDINDDLTCELGLSYANGENSYVAPTSLEGADLTFKWRPADGGRDKSLGWSTEFLSRDQAPSSGADELSQGLASWLQYQFKERWITFYRYDNLYVQNALAPTTLPNGMEYRHSVALAFNASEFSTFKLELDYRHGGLTSTTGDSDEKAIYLQANFTIGSHPAHSY